MTSVALVTVLRAAGRAGVAVCLWGDPGIGKSALITAAAEADGDYVADVCVADEAWQLTFADLGGLGPLSAQVVLVGDPGQIAPVVTGDSRRWQDLPAGPQRAAPEALVAAYPEAVTRLPPPPSMPTDAVPMITWLFGSARRARSSRPRGKMWSPISPR